MSHFYRLGDRTGDRICDAVCEYKSPSGYCSLTICSKQFDQPSFAECIFCKYDFEKGDVLYNRTSCDKGMVFEEVTVNYCPCCGRKL